MSEQQIKKQLKNVIVNVLISFVLDIRDGLLYNPNGIFLRKLVITPEQMGCYESVIAYDLFNIIGYSNETKEKYIRILDEITLELRQMYKQFYYKIEDEHKMRVYFEL